MATATKNSLMPALMTALACTKETTVPTRMNALGLTVECSRCGGCGNYSYCPSHGTTCFKCNGSGKQMPRLTQKLVKQAAEMVAGGALNSYLERVRKIGQLKKVEAELRGTLEVIGVAYSAAYKVDRAGGGKIPAWLYEMQKKSNSIVFQSTNGKIYSENRVEEFGIKEVQMKFEYSKKPLTDAEKDALLARVEALKVIAAELVKLFEAKQTVAALLGM